MKTIIDNKEYELFFSNSFKGKGSWNISCEVEGLETFNTHTTDSEFIDSLTELEENNATFEEIQKAYYNAFFYKFKEKIEEYLFQLENN